MCKAFSPYTQLKLLKAKPNTVRKCMLQLFKKYKARNTRHLMYIRYKRNQPTINMLKATPKGMGILDKIAHGYTYCEIAMMHNVSKSCVEKHIRVYGH